MCGRNQHLNSHSASDDTSTIQVLGVGGTTVSIHGSDGFQVQIGDVVAESGFLIQVSILIQVFGSGFRTEKLVNINTALVQMVEVYNITHTHRCNM